MCIRESWKTWTRVVAACSLALVTSCSDAPQPAADVAAERIVGDDASAAGEQLAERLAEGDPPPRTVVEAMSAALLEARNRVTGNAVKEEAGFFVGTLPTVVEEELRRAGDEWPEVLLAGIVHAYGTPRPVMMHNHSTDDETRLAAAIRLRTRSTDRLDDELLAAIADRTLWFPARLRAIVALCRPASIEARDELVAIALDRRQSASLRSEILARLHRFGTAAPESLEPIVWDTTGRLSTHGALVLAGGGRPIAPSIVLDWLRGLARARSAIQVELKLSTPDAAIGMCPGNEGVRTAAEAAQGFLDVRLLSPRDEDRDEQALFKALLAAAEAHVAAHPEILDTPFEIESAACDLRGQARLDAALGDVDRLFAPPTDRLDVIAAAEVLGAGLDGPKPWALARAERLTVEIRTRIGERRDAHSVAAALRDCLSADAKPTRTVGLFGIAVSPLEALGMACGDDASTAALVLSVCDALGVPAQPRRDGSRFVVDVGAGDQVEVLDLDAWTRLRAPEQSQEMERWCAVAGGDGDPESVAHPRHRLLSRLLMHDARLMAAEPPWLRGGTPELAELAALTAKRAVRLSPRSLRARLTLARMTAGLGAEMQDAARAELAGARAIRSFSLIERLDEAHALLALGDRDESRQILDALAEETPPPPLAARVRTLREQLDDDVETPK